MIQITYPMKAISKDNEKIYNRSGKFYTSRKYRSFEQLVKYYTLAHGHTIMYSGKVKLDVKFYFKNKKHCDLPNLAKSVCDALTGIIYKDDKQIYEISMALAEDSKDEYFVVTAEEIG